LLKGGQAHEVGACVFLDPRGACRIYAHRPYVCRTQGLPLRWLEAKDNEPIVEYRDICPLNDRGVPVEALNVQDCWTLGPAEEALAQLQERSHPGDMRRVPLRSLFHRTASGS
jgi:hypothetical protein